MCSFCSVVEEPDQTRLVDDIPRTNHIKQAQQVRHIPTSITVSLPILHVGIQIGPFYTNRRLNLLCMKRVQILIFKALLQILDNLYLRRWNGWILVVPWTTDTRDLPVDKVEVRFSGMGAGACMDAIEVLRVRIR